ncbi:PREDICTED: uncharacterized protein LOC106317369 [Brassica oleracea var. oleracea]|uniref:uncharacterized protein LOC106317369 n=1 Tax=Brassica oleracea var. oleracea TaxID=109376 RepID=UPI0006A71D5C|nr:PREDICTED: uncharacterized protein LOC106317369 [Brassica oleracea var. oleracea]
MSVAQSERNATERSSSFIASVIPLRRASDSAMRGELTLSMMHVPDEKKPNCSLVNRQAVPARFDDASKLHLRNNRLCGFVWGLVAKVTSQVPADPWENWSSNPCRWEADHLSGFHHQRFEICLLLNANW